MAILPPVMDYSPKDLRYTFRPINPDTDRKELMDEIAHYLEQWRDFDVKRFDVTEEADLKDSYSKFAQTLASWSEINQKVHGLPDELSRKLTEFGENQGVDGIMLISVLGLATLTASMYADSMRGDKAYVQVDIFSVESPRRVWQSNAVLMNFGNHNEFSANESYGESLFGKMERALPDIYIRQKPVLEQSR
jgi:hypothetical protein